VRQNIRPSDELSRAPWRYVSLGIVQLRKRCAAQRAQEHVKQRELLTSCLVRCLRKPLSSHVKQKSSGRPLTLKPLAELDRVTRLQRVTIHMIGCRLTCDKRSRDGRPGGYSRCLTAG
jgi:hypothetical protein